MLDTRPSTRVGFSGSKPAPGATVAASVLGTAGVPTSGVSAVVLNVTMTEPEGPGFATAMPVTTPPATSNVNVDAAGRTVATEVIVPVASDGTVPVDVSVSTHLVVDVFGWYTDATATAGTSGLFIPVSPYRALDTRNSGGPLAAAGVVHLLTTAAGRASSCSRRPAATSWSTSPAGTSDPPLALARRCVRG